MPTPRADDVLRALEAAILSGRLKPRQRLIETELAAMFGVGRSLIRQAVIDLAARGLVETTPQKGARVIDISDEAVDDVYRIRMSLELMAAELMVARVTPEALVAIKRLQDEYVDAVERGAFEQMILKNEVFHRALYAASGNKLLCELLEKVRNVTFPLRYAAYFIPGRAAQSVDDHVTIIDALERRDLAALTQVIEQSIRYPKEIYLSRKHQPPESKSA